MYNPTVSFSPEQTQQATKGIMSTNGKLIGSIGANGFLAGLHEVLVKYQTELNSLLTVLQIVIAVATIAHFAKVWYAAWKKKHEKK